jgi:hypothetical protein
MVTATAPAKITNQQLRIIPLATAGLLALMAVLQLVNFGGFVLIVKEYSFLPYPLVITTAIALPALEIFALPFLLHLWLSRAARVVSIVFGVLVPLKWFGLWLFATLSGQHLTNTGLLGDLVPMPLGLGSLLLIMVLAAGIGVSFYVLNGCKAFDFKRR